MKLNAQTPNDPDRCERIGDHFLVFRKNTQTIYNCGNVKHYLTLYLVKLPETWSALGNARYS